ncbi:MAG: glycerophosphodiester phosphodiesterase [Nitrososphaerales archaeon]
MLAHRGGRGPWRENTIEAFRGALATGADGIELDVRRAADGTLAVHHDAVIEGLGPVHELDRSLLPSWVPTLSEALAACAGSLVNVEIKNSPMDEGYDPREHVSQEVARMLVLAGVGGPAEVPGSVARTDVTPATVVVSSFSPGSLAAVKQAAARAGDPLPLGLLVHPAFDPRDALDVAKDLGCESLHPFHSQVTEELVRSAHDNGMAVITWTVNSAAELQAVRAAGVDGVISDDVTGALRSLGTTPS